MAGVRADADARAAAAAAILSLNRRRTAPLLSLETAYISGVSRDVRQHRLRGLLAGVTGLDAHAFVDVDRFGVTTAVTPVADEVPVFVAALGAGPVAAVPRVLPGADP